MSFGRFPALSGASGRFWVDPPPPRAGLTARSYAVDGNALFLSASECAWRRPRNPRYLNGCVIVAIGYPEEESLWIVPRRNWDLTPPRPGGGGGAGAGAPQPAGHGGAAHLVAFLETTLQPFVASTVLAGSTVGRTLLYGHSYGGLFVLYTLFTRPALFDGYAASSPSAFWDNGVILQHEAAFRAAQAGQAPAKAGLMLYFGAWEQEPPQWVGEDDAAFRRRLAEHHQLAQTDNTTAMFRRLRASGCVGGGITLKSYPAEDHGTVMAGSLSRAMTSFLEEWPLGTVIKGELGD